MDKWGVTSLSDTLSCEVDYILGAKPEGLMLMLVLL